MKCLSPSSDQARPAFAVDALQMMLSLLFAQLWYVLSLLLIARWVPPEALGGYALFISFCSFFTVSGGWAYENAFFVCAKDQERQLLWVAALLACLSNALFACMILSILVAYQFGISADLVPFIPFYIVLQCLVVILLADHASRGRFKVIAKNRYIRAFVTTVIWFVAIAVPVHFSEDVLILGVVLGAALSAQRLYQTSSHYWQSWRVSFPEVWRVMWQFRRYPLKEAPSLFLGSVSRHGIIVATGFCYGVEQAGLVGMAILALTKPAGVITHSFGMVAQDRFSQALRRGDVSHARRIFMLAAIFLWIAALLGAVFVWIVMPQLVPIFLGPAWVDVIEVVILITPAMIASIAMRPMMVFLSAGSMQNFMMRQELVVSIVPVISYIIVFAIKFELKNALLAYSLFYFLLYIAHYFVIVYRLYFIGMIEVSTFARQEC